MRKTLDKAARLAAALVALSLTACLDLVTPGEPMPGTYVLTFYEAGPSADARLDMYARGVRWKVVVGTDNRFESTTWIEGDMIAEPTTRTGTVQRVGSTVNFSGAGNPLLTERTWTLTGDQLAAVDQTVMNVNATIRFTRQ